MASIIDNGLFSSNIREIMGMSAISPISGRRVSEVTPDKDKIGVKTQSFQDSMVKMTKEQNELLKKLLSDKGNITQSTVSVATGMLAANIVAKLPVVRKTLDTLDIINKQSSLLLEKTKRAVVSRQSSNNYARSSSGIPKIPAVATSGRPLNQSMIRAPQTGGLLSGGTGDLMLGALGGLGLTSLAGGAKAGLGLAGRVASKAALPLAAVYAGYEGIKGAFNADEILGRESTTFDKVRVGISEAVDGVLLGLPSMLTEKVFGKKYSVAVNDMMINVGDSISSVVANGFNAIKDNALNTFESIYNSLPSVDQITSTFGAVRDKLYDTVSGYADGIVTNTSNFLSSASNWISSGFNKAGASISNFFKVSGTENLTPIDENSMRYGQQTTSAKTAEVVGEKVSDYLDEKLKKRDEGFMAWLKGLVGLGGALSPSSDPTDNKGQTIGGGASGAGNITSGGSGNGGNVTDSSGSSKANNVAPAKSINASTITSQPVQMASVGKTEDGKDVKIPLPPDAGRMFSNAFGRIDYANPNGGSAGTPYTGQFVDPKSNPNVNQDIIKKYEGRQLPVVIRNNNPAALSLMNPGSGKEFAEKQEGYVGATARPANEGGYYAKYATPEHGVAANAKLLEKYGQNGVNTTDAIVRKWSTDTGAHAAYSKRLQAALGVDGSTPLDLNDKEVQRKILMAKSAHESGTGKAIYNEDTFRRGVNREFGSPDLKGGYKEPSYLNGSPAGSSKTLDGLVPVKTSGGKTEYQNIDEMAKNQRGQAFGGGETNAGTLAAAKAINALQGDNVNRFTAFNDNYHAGSRSKHATGLAGDFTLKDATQSEKSAAALNDMFKKAGLKEGDYRIIDEYKNPSARATGGHIHYQFNSPEAAASFVKSLGDPKIRASMGIKDSEMAKPIDDKMASKADIYNNSPFLKSRQNAQGFDDSKPIVEPKKPSEAAPFSNRGDEEGNRGGVRAEQPISPNIKSPETKEDVTPAESSGNMGNGGFNNTAPPDYKEPSSGSSDASSAYYNTPSIDNELSMLSVNSTMLS